MFSRCCDAQLQRAGLVLRDVTCYSDTGCLKPLRERVGAGDPRPGETDFSVEAEQRTTTRLDLLQCLCESGEGKNDENGTSRS